MKRTALWTLLLFATTAVICDLIFTLLGVHPLPWLTIPILYLLGAPNGLGYH